MNSPLKGNLNIDLVRPNRRFEIWLTEWRNEAIQTGSKMVRCYNTALESLQQFPLPLNSGRECKILRGFGDKLCKMLDQKLAEDINNKQPEQKEYIPTLRSGPYAILITLYKKCVYPSYEGFMYKHDITKEGQIHCEKSFTKRENNSFYTAWSGMKTLVEKRLVSRRGCPARFSLTQEGLKLASKLHANSFPNDHNVATEESDTEVLNVSVELNKTKELPVDGGVIDEPGPSKQPPKKKASVNSKKKLESPVSEIIDELGPQAETLIFVPNSFEIVLIVDQQERTGGFGYDNGLPPELENLGVDFEIRRLNVGDYTWICREKTTKQELVLPYIIERKRLDDFGSSIKDGRYREQKFRLKRCGIANVTYLIESVSDKAHCGLPLTTLNQAAINTLIHDGFNIKFTDNYKSTVQYLATFTNILNKMFKEKTLISCPRDNLQDSMMDDDLTPLMIFQEFNKTAAKQKNYKVKELFTRQLLQLRGVSVEKALAITNKYPTPLLLKLDYDSNPTKGELLLASIEFGNLKKKIGPVISKTIHKLYTLDTF